jgi:hypothetical protein
MSINTANNSLLSPRIRYLALTVRWSAIAAMATILILGTYSLVHQSFSWTARPLLGVVATVRPSPASTIDPQLALWLELLPAAVLFYGLLRLVQMMRACERGEIFSLRVATHLQAFSAAIVVAELLSITLPLQVAALRSVLGRMNAAVDLTISGDQLWSLLLAALFLVLAQILKEAVRVAEDNASIV